MRVTRTAESGAKLLGVLMISARLEALSDDLARSMPVDEGVMYIADHKLNILASSLPGNQGMDTSYDFSLHETNQNSLPVMHATDSDTLLSLARARALGAPVLFREEYKDDLLFMDNVSAGKEEGGIEGEGGLLVFWSFG